MSSQYFKKFNANKWGKLHGDCAIRSLVIGLGIDYEVICKKLGVKCVKGEGYVAEDGNEGTGIDLELIQKTFASFLGDIQDVLLADPDIDPVKAMLDAEPLADWLKHKKYKTPGLYLIFLDDNKENDGGHIVFANCLSQPYYYDISNCDDMPVQAWIKINKRIKSDSKYHYKYNKETRKFE